MARRHPRTAADTPPEVLRFDLRFTSAHPLTRSWAFRRPFLSGQAIKAALERVIELRGEEGLDRLLAELAAEGEEGGGIERQALGTQAAPKGDRLSAPNIEASAPNIGQAAPMISEPAPHISAVAPVHALAEAAPAAEVSSEPQEPVVAAVRISATHHEVVSTPVPSPQPQINAVNVPDAVVPGADQATVQRAETPPQAQDSGAGEQPGASPVDALTSIGADILRTKKMNNMAALLQNEALFNGGASSGRNLV